MQIQIDSKIIDQFVKSARDTKATVEIIPCDAQYLNEALISSSGNNMVLFSEPDDLETELFSLFKLNDNVITEPTNEQLSKIKMGVTDAFCAVASTGSVCVSVTKNLSTHASMLTQKHIVIVDGKTIVQRPRDIFFDCYLGGKGLKRSFSIITGPSATADMGPLVRGVHGPRELHIIILDLPAGQVG